MADVSFPNYGVAQGLAEGLKQGLITYQNQKNIQQQNQMQQLMTGVQKNPDSGQLEYTPEKKQQMQTQGLLAQRSADELDPNSDVSQRLGAVRGQILHNADAKSSPDMFNGLSAADQKETEGLIKPEISGQYGMLKQAYNPLVQVKQGQLDETRNQNAAGVGKAYEADSIIKNSKVKANAMAQSSAILRNPNKPVLANDFNAAYQDYLAGTAPGGVPTEGKAHREMPVNFELDWNKLKSQVGENDDLRATPQGQALIGLLMKNIDSSVGELRGQRKEQAKHIHENYVDSSNPKVQSTNERKYHEYADDDATPTQGQGLLDATGGGAGKVKVSNGKQTLLIDQDDLADAQKDGFQAVK